MGEKEYYNLLQAARKLAANPKIADSAWELNALGMCIRLHDLERANLLCDEGRQVRNALSAAVKKSQEARSSSRST